MAVQTSSITTAANGNLSVSPNGTGQVVISPLGGSNNQPVGVDNVGQLYQFNITDLAAGTPAGTDILMMEIGGNQEKVTAQQLVDASNAINLTGLSVTQNAASGAGALTYTNTSGVFTYTPPTIGGLGGIGLAALSITTAATGTATGGLAYDNTTGIFTFTPVASAASLVAATQAEQQAGTLTTVYSSPATSVAKDGATTTGAAIISSGTLAQRPAAAATGMLRFNTDTPTWEFYNGTSWGDLVPAGSVLLAATDAEQIAGTLTTVYSSPATSVAKDAATITGAIHLSGGTTAQRPAAPVAGQLRYNTDRVNTEWYNGTAWGDLMNEPVTGVTSVNVVATKDQYWVVDTAGKTVTLPATPTAGDCVSVVVNGAFVDTIVARNGSNIMGLAEDITLDKNYAAMDFTFINATEGWRLS